ncbi:MAG: type II toxin-antitoxin system RelE/ParE family toxin [Dokdonella sp.]
MTYSLHPGAEQDIADALDFYTERAGLLVAQRFLDEFERVAKLLVTHPDFGTPTKKERRVFPLRVFPYSAVYRSLEAGIRIIAVRHQHRKPGYGDARR